MADMSTVDCDLAGVNRREHITDTKTYGLTVDSDSMVTDDVGQTFWLCTEILNRGKEFVAAGCHRQARAEYMEGFRLLLSAYWGISHSSSRTSHHVPPPRRSRTAVHFVERTVSYAGRELLFFSA